MGAKGGELDQPLLHFFKALLTGLLQEFEIAGHGSIEVVYCLYHDVPRALQINN